MMEIKKKMIQNQKNLQKVPDSTLKSEVCSELFSHSKFLGSSKRLHSSPLLKMESFGFDDNIQNKMKGGIDEMEKTEVNYTRMIYHEDCAICGKVIKGTSEESVNFNMRLHLSSKHKNSSKKQ